MKLINETLSLPYKITEYTWISAAGMVAIENESALEILLRNGLDLLTYSNK